MYVYIDMCMCVLLHGAKPAALHHLLIPEGLEALKMPVQSLNPPQPDISGPCFALQAEHKGRDGACWVVVVKDCAKGAEKSCSDSGPGPRASQELCS